MKRITMTTGLAIAVLGIGLSPTAHARPAHTPSGAKYVFFFLGDGLSASQIQATEAYLTTRNGGSAKSPSDLQNPTNRLTLCKLPVQGMQTTYDDGALMTDSASAGTAFACGIKTLSGVIGKNRAKTESYKSVAQLAKELQGKKIGILSSVSIDHATPASYYASVNSRSAYNDISRQLTETGYNFFGGGGFVQPVGANDTWALLASAGYTVISNRADMLALETSPRDKVVCINPWLQDSSAMPYELDRRNQPNGTNNLSLAELTDAAIACLKDSANGFFIMVEGGKIDWACHANDAVATMEDVLGFDDAVKRAVAFYEAHPNDTLIIVTGDHETGGMTVGHATTAYTECYANLLGQTESFQQFGMAEWKTHKDAFSSGYDWAKTNLLSGDADAVAFGALLQSKFGLKLSDLNADQFEKLEDAYDKSMVGQNDNSAAANTLLYGTYEPVVVTITHILNERGSIGWTSYSHTGVPVPVFAIGFDAYRFEGFYDNTDIAKQLAKAMRMSVALPVLK